MDFLQIQFILSNLYTLCWKLATYSVINQQPIKIKMSKGDI